MGLLDTLKGFFSPQKYAENKQAQKKAITDFFSPKAQVEKARVRQETIKKSPVYTSVKQFFTPPKTKEEARKVGVAPTLKPIVSIGKGILDIRKHFEENPLVKEKEYKPPEEVLGTKYEPIYNTIAQWKKDLIMGGPIEAGSVKTIGKVIEEISPKIAKIEKAEDVFKVVKKFFKGESDDVLKLLSEKLAPVKNVKSVDEILNDFYKIKPSEAVPKLGKELEPLVAEAKKYKSALEQYTPKSQKTISIFEGSKNQKLIAKRGEVNFELGSFGKNHQIRKEAEKKFDRFTENDLPETIKNIKKVYRASNDPTNYRYDNIIHIAEMPNGETRAVYTRINKNGAEEIINWHIVPDTKKDKFLNTLSSFGIPSRTQTGIIGLEGQRTIQLSYGDKLSISQNDKFVKSKAFPKIVKQEFRADKLDLGAEGTAKIEADRARLGLTSRKVRSVDEVKAIAEEVGSDPQKLLKEIESGRITDSEVVALRNTIASNTDYVLEQSRLLDSPALTKREKELLQFKINKAQEVIDRGLNKLIVGGTEAGRAVASYKILANKTLDPVFWQKKALHLSGKKTLDAPILKAIDEFIKQKDKLGLAKLMMEVRKATPTEKIITLWKAGLLTSPTTHLANIGGNLSMTILENIAQAPAAAIDKLISLRTGRRTKTGLSGSRLLEQLKGAKKGISEAGDYMKYGVSEAERLKWDIPRQVNYNNKVLQGYTQAIFRSLGAEDKVFKQAKIADSLLEQAKVALKNKDDIYKYATDALKKEGKELTDKNVVKFLVENPLDEMGLIAINDAEYITFQSENVLAKMFSGAKQGARQRSEFAEGALNFIAPFSKTPSNVAARIVDYSPVGLLKTIFGQLKKENRFWKSKEAQKAFSEMMGRGITGTGVLALGAYLATEGLITGAYPTDPTERMLWEQEGKQSNSILIGGKWRNMDKISPVGNLLTLGAKYTEHKKEGAQGFDVLSKTAASGVKGLTEQTFLQGLSGALGAVSDPERGAAKYTRQAVASTVPTLIGKLARIADPVKREQVRWWEGAQAKVPFLSKMLPEKLDSFGQQQLWENGTFGWRALFDPFISKEAKDTVLTGELRRLWENDYKVKPTDLDASTSVSGVKIKYSQNELNVLKSAIGNVWLKILTEAVNSPKYEGLSDYDKQKALRGIIGDIKEEIVKANPPYGTGILRRAGVKVEDTPTGDVLNTIMIEIIETPEWKKMTDDDREKLVKSLYAKLLEKGITAPANPEL